MINVLFIKISTCLFQDKAWHHLQHDSLHSDVQHKHIVRWADGSLASAPVLS